MVTQEIEAIVNLTCKWRKQMANGKLGIGSLVKLKTNKHKLCDPSEIVMLNRQNKQVSMVIVQCSCGHRVGVAPKRVVPHG